MLDSDPVKQFSLWYGQARAADIDKPNAMCLSTVTAELEPASRILLLSSFDDHGFVFHTNYLSHKGKELEGNANACLLFWWDILGYQIRINGRIEKTTTAESDAYFGGRPHGSQIGAWASEQSQAISSRQELEDRVLALSEQYANQDVPRPPHWGGYRLVPVRYEFWVNGTDRLHDRFLFLPENGVWSQQRLAP